MKRLLCLFLTALLLLPCSSLADGNGFTVADLSWVPTEKVRELLKEDISRYDNGATDYITIRSIHYYLQLLLACEPLTETYGSEEEDVLRLVDEMIGGNTGLDGLWIDYLDGKISADDYINAFRPYLP